MRCVAYAVALLGLYLLAVPVLPAMAADQADRAAAIKEGDVNWYTSTPFPLVQVLADRFTAETGASGFDPSATSASMPCCSSEPVFNPYQSNCLSRYDAVS